MDQINKIKVFVLKKHTKTINNLCTFIFVKKEFGIKIFSKTHTHTHIIKKVHLKNNKYALVDIINVY